MHTESRESGIVFESAEFRKVLVLAERLAHHDVSVLIHGETGTGKELLARVLHYRSSRADRPFIPVNAGALVDTLVENELFGHAAGAFTDARSRGQGLVELAAGGTLFLDEIDALGAHGQAALLRFLQDGQYRPVGSSREFATDIRMITATNAEPSNLVREGIIRKDLYYRLAAVTLHVPALRDRPDDILPLARHFLAELNAGPSGRNCRIGPAMTVWLLAQEWPGNVRELRSVIEYSFIMCDGDILMPPITDEAPIAPTIGSFRSEKANAVSAFEQSYLRRVMRECDGNVSRAARAAQKERKGFDRLLKKHGIQRRAFMPGQS